MRERLLEYLGTANQRRERSSLVGSDVLFIVIYHFRADLIDLEGTGGLAKWSSASSVCNLWPLLLGLIHLFRRICIWLVGGFYQL